MVGKVIVAALLFGGTAFAEPFAFDAWDGLLKKYVDAQGRVDYAALQASAADRRTFDRVVESTGAAQQTGKAFHLNAYNVLVWRGVLDLLPGLTRVDQVKPSFFDKKYLVAGKQLSLNQLESEVVRPTYKDARVHFALNCASGGCPRLPAEAFTPARVEQQLEREAKRFCNEKRNVDYDAAGKTVRLSHIFDWYRADFGNVLESINRWRADKLPLDAKIAYVDYDWTLNRQ